MATPASHVVAALGSFNEHLALWTAFPVFEVFLEVGITGTDVLYELAFLAVLCSASIAFVYCCRSVNSALTVLFWTKFEVRIVDGLLPYHVPSILISCILW